MSYLPFLGLLKIKQRLFLERRARGRGVCLGHHRCWERVMINNVTPTYKFPVHIQLWK
jgi:hypothetical protein